MIGFKMMTGLVAGTMIGMVAAPYVTSMMHKKGFRMMPYKIKANKFMKRMKRTAFRTFKDLVERV